MARQMRKCWILCVRTFVLACCGNALAQVSYTVTDLGTLGKDNLGCAMSLNDQGWTEIMAGSFAPGQQDFVPAYPLHGRAVLDVHGHKVDLLTLGGSNTWMMWGQINDRGQIVGYSETDFPDPNGEDVCRFGTHVTCLPFLWQNFHMRALRTLGGANGQASGINQRGQIVGFAENGEVDPTCQAGTTNNRIDLGALWESGQGGEVPEVLPPLVSDRDSVAYAINEKGEAVGYSGTCSGPSHAVLWQQRSPTPLPDNGYGATAFDINIRGQIVGSIGLASGNQYAALWENKTLIDLKTLKNEGDYGAIASGINGKGVVVGSTWDSGFHWSHGFIYRNGAMTDLNRLISANSNLCVTMANKINALGQISGMAVVLSGPNVGDVHAVLLTPVNESIRRSVAGIAATCPKGNTPMSADVGNRVVPGLRPDQFLR